MREFYEKARKEPEKYEKLLIERLDGLENSSRHTFNWIIALLNIELAYVVFLWTRALYTALFYLPLLFILTSTILLILRLFLIVREISVVEEVLYGDPMNIKTIDKIIIWYLLASSIFITLIGVYLLMSS